LSKGFAQTQAGLMAKFFAAVAVKVERQGGRGHFKIHSIKQ